MFTQEDIGQLNRVYFDIIQITGYHIVVRSRNSKHFWDIECVELFHGGRQIIIKHKHNDSDSFHVQKGCHPRNIREAQNLIKSHDGYFLKKKAIKREMLQKKRMGNWFADFNKISGSILRGSLFKNKEVEYRIYI